MFSEDCTALLHDPAASLWLRFARARQILIASSVEEVMPLLERVQNAVERRNWFAVGFVSYEAAPGFDPAYRVKEQHEFPLAWFGLFDGPKVTSGPANDRPLRGCTDWEFPMSLEEFTSGVDRIKGYIRTGDTYQVNYTMRLSAPASKDVAGLFAAMVEAQGPHYAAFIDTGRFSICSASPELFFRLDGSQLTCRPMKGTAPRGLWPAQDKAQGAGLLGSEKNRAENIMITDMVRNDMGRVAETGTVMAANLFQAEQYPTIWQMTSTVRCETAKSLPEIFRALFPAASITGAPKVRTMQIIAELEQTPRRIYTGAIGFIAPGRKAQFNVAIRTVLVDKATQTAEYGVGGGIVWDSVPREEWEECRTKARILAPAKPAFQLLETMLWTPAEGISLLEEHLRRLAESAEYFSMPLALNQVRDRLFARVSNLAPVPHRVRLLVGRDGTLSFETQPLAPLPEPYRVALARDPINTQDVFLYHKTTRRELYEQALSARPGCDDVLLWNERGELTESTIGNLVVEKGGRFLTPPLRCGLLPGIYREVLLREQRVQEDVLSVEDLGKCERVFLANSVRGMWEIRWERG